MEKILAKSLLAVLAVLAFADRARIAFEWARTGIVGKVVTATAISIVIGGITVFLFGASVWQAACFFANLINF